MADLNMVDFYKDTAKILTQLHKSFPRKVDLYVEDLIGPDHVDEFGLHSKRHESCFGSMLWLAEEGYIRFQSTTRQEVIDQAILSSKSLVSLSTMNNELPTTQTATDSNLPAAEANERLTMIEHIRVALNSQSSDQLTLVMREFFSRY